MAKFIEITIPEYGKAVQTLINVERIMKVASQKDGKESQIFWEIPEQNKAFCETVSIPFEELKKMLTE